MGWLAVTDRDDILFGRDMRHKPPLPQMLTSNQASPVGRYHYACLSRSVESNYSEYAYRKIGMMPPGYVIVSVAEIRRYNRDTALRVSHGRVAIPVREFARIRHLSCAEQWELMHPQWVGTYFVQGDTERFRSRRDNFGVAVVKAIERDEYDAFMSQFWRASVDHAAAINRMRRSLGNVRGDILMMNASLTRNIERVKAIERQLSAPSCKDRLALRNELTDARYDCDRLLSLISSREKRRDRIQQFLQKYDI